MKKFIWNDKWTGPDKVKHLGLCFVLAMLVGILYTPVLGLQISILLALLKDLVYDMILEKGTPSFQDIAVSSVGAFAAYLIMITGVS